MGSVYSKTLSEKYDIDVYLLPNFKLTDREKYIAKTVLTTGASGAGKTTLLNSLVNKHFGIKITDNFRYVLINEDTGRS